MLKPPEPILVADLFPEVLDELLTLLKSLSAQEWEKPTVCAGWSVKDVALHLLGGTVAKISRGRDGHSSNAPINGWEELVAFLNEWNQGWVLASRRISTRLLIDLLGFTGRQLCEYYHSLNPYILGESVSWAGPQPAPVWLDLAREYTEHWHHQQHIRDAVDKPGLKDPRHMAPVLAAFVWAMPRAYQSTPAADGVTVTLTIRGESGGCWSLLREGTAWKLYQGAPAQPAAEVILDQDAAWRLFTRGISRATARGRMAIRGDQALGLVVLEMVSIIA
ncbi:MAG: maleylpyruvate isomerase N-terminal domain-containing protein [Chloroflexi bacterium]|nr:maleylpyruvate isomerase N-terminal domain-containing protein [Chloroflexota bacterium]MCL5275538.1 maleylpyruvate isomerase N-terminal domain-containing protein [Chloroflexota bacterium]